MQIIVLTHSTPVGEYVLSAFYFDEMAMHSCPLRQRPVKLTNAQQTDFLKIVYACTYISL